MKLYKRSFALSMLLLVYAALIIFFLTIPAFENTILSKKSEITIITLVPLIAVILAIRILTTKKKAEMEELLHSFSKQEFLTRFFFVYGAAVFTLAPISLFTESVKEIHMCDTIWHPAWIISLIIAVAATILLFIYGRKKVDFRGQLIFICVITFPMAYFFPIILFKLLAFWTNCLD